MRKMRFLVSVFAILGLFSFTAACGGGLCKKACKKMKKCASEMKLGDKFNDQDKCVKECKKDMDKKKGDKKIMEKCLKKDGCKEFFGCLMEEAMKKKK